MSDTGDSITKCLERLREGEPGAEEALIERLYDDLHRLARNYMRRERAGHSLQATALVNEAYLKMIDHKERNWQNKGHFMAAAATAMRRILIDHARTRLSERRGGGQERMPLDENSALTTQRPEELIELDLALNRLAGFAPDLARIVEWKYFGGLSDDEIADLLQVSPRTVKRRWTTAKTWLYGELAGPAGGTETP